MKSAKTLVLDLVLIGMTLPVSLFIAMRQSGNDPISVLLVASLFLIAILMCRTRTYIRSQQLAENKFKALPGTAQDVAVIVSDSKGKAPRFILRCHINLK